MNGVAAAKPLVLVVDDTPTNVLVLSEALRPDYRIVAATSGQAALELLNGPGERPALILLDVMMPGMDGHEVCRRIKADPTLAGIPVIFVTARDDADAEAEGLSAGAADYLTKPINVIIARLRIGNLLERERAQAEVRALNAELEQRVARRTAELEAANRELEQLSYSISHDMRTPLRAILGFSTLLLDEHGDRLGEEERRLQRVVVDHARRMDRAIEDLLLFLDLGRRNMALAPVDLAGLAREVWAELLAAAPGRGARLEIGPLPPARADRAMARQVLANLFSNALKFAAPERELVVDFSGRAEAQGNVYCVKDNGVGFDMRYVDKLFQVFERVHPTGRYEGSGVGLAIVRRIVVRHGGRVWAEGRVDAGAAIWFVLPPA